MVILIWEIANGITNQSRVHDQHKPAKKYQFHCQYRGAAAEGGRSLYPQCELLWN